MERERIGLPSFARPGDACGCLMVPSREVGVGSGIGSVDAGSIGLGSTDEHPEASGGESRVRASGLWTIMSSAWVPSSALMLAMAE